MPNIEQARSMPASLSGLAVPEKARDSLGKFSGQGSESWTLRFCLAALALLPALALQAQLNLVHHAYRAVPTQALSGYEPSPERRIQGPV